MKKDVPHSSAHTINRSKKSRSRGTRNGNSFSNRLEECRISRLTIRDSEEVSFFDFSKKDNGGVPPIKFFHFGKFSRSSNFGMPLSFEVKRVCG